MEQDEHDKRMANLTEQKLDEIVKSLSEIARSKLQKTIAPSINLLKPLSAAHSKEQVTMPIRELTQQEIEERLGDGLVIFGAAHSKPSAQNSTPLDDDELADQALLQQQLERALVSSGGFFEIPANSKLFDVDGVPVARLADGSCIAFGAAGARPYLDSAKVFSYGSPIEKAEFDAIVAALKASV